MPQLSKHKKRVYTGIAAAVLVVGAALVFFGMRHTSNYTPFLPKAPETTASVTPNPAAKELAEQTATPSPIPTSDRPQQSSNGQIVLTSPTQGSKVTSGTVVTGQATATGGQLYYRVKGKDSGQLASGVLKVASTGASPSAFSFTLAFTQGAVAGEQGVLELYGVDKSGQEENLVSVGVYLQ